MGVSTDYHNALLSQQARQQQLGGLMGIGGLAGLQQQIDMQREAYMQASRVTGMSDYERKPQRPKAKTIREELQDEVDEWIKDVI